MPALAVVKHAQMLAGVAFDLEGGVPVLRRGLTPRLLITAVDPDLLAALNGQRKSFAGDGFAWPALPGSSTAAVERLLANGTVDTHIHLGGALSPAHYWTILMSGELPFVLARALAAPEGAKWSRWLHRLIHAAWIRYRLAARLRRFLISDPFPLGAAVDSAEWQVFEEDPPPPALAQRAILRLGRPFRARGGNLRPYRDPLLWHVWDDDRRLSPLAGERRLVHLAASYVNDSSHPLEPRETVAAMVVDYARVRNAFYQSLTHQLGTFGLARFDGTFRRRRLGFERNLRPALQFERYRTLASLEEQLDDAFIPATRTPGIPRRIELRVSIARGRGMLRRLRSWLDAIGTYLDSTVAPRQIGLVVHFLKLNPDKNGAPANDQSAILADLLRQYPGLRPLIVGVDAAGSERLGVPREFITAYHRLQDLQSRYQARDAEPRIRLGLTYHAGEDVWDLLTGLRHIDETETLLFCGQGSSPKRLGHALALGDRPDAFYSRRRNVEVGLATHLLDLVWAWGRCRGDRALASHSGWLSERIESLILQRRLMGGGAVQPAPAIESTWHCMGLEPRNIDNVASEKALVANLLSCVGHDQNAPMDPASLERTLAGRLVVEPDATWLGLLDALQKQVAVRLALGNVAIEANPTSNLMIGGFERYQDLPYDLLVRRGLRVSINTDDPGLFATSLPGEFQRMLDALLAAGWTHRAAEEWLNERLRDAEYTSFLRTGVQPTSLKEVLVRHPPTDR